MSLIFEEVSLHNDSQTPCLAFVEPHKLPGPKQILAVLGILVLFVASRRW